ncbi:metalloregulator ArsR/SmtB family transcription factor [Phenylobacterium sp.]|uniref:ArsR/SmtB family transcription factor n=1 Tax=Phenylobacterium sp. TaxID=1871053 RepID=UPI002897C235|nr:metalloregulator ArsR/SmtB family transcription factor [Phenylobacterium sp.]
MPDQSSASPKHTVFAGLAEVAKALASANRIEIVELLGQGERSVDGIAGRLGLSVANASQHLQVMRRAGLLASRRDGKRVLYRLSDPAVVDLMTSLGRLGERNQAEIRAVVGGYFHDLDAMEPVSRGELIDRLKDGLVTVLDVRPEDEFVAGRLPSAVNIPLRDLAKRLAELPRDQEIVAYCRGPYCVLAFEAVALLRESGFRVRRLEDGFPEWKAAGLPVA